MKKILNILLIIVFTTSLHSQTEITYEKVLSEIKKSDDILCTVMIIPNKDFNIGIFPEDWEVEDLSMEQCGDIKTDSIKNHEIINILESEKLLDKLFIQLDNNEYESINSIDRFKWDKMSLVLELSSKVDWVGLYVAYIPIKEKKRAKRIINLISKLYDKDYCFRKLKRNL